MLKPFSTSKRKIAVSLFGLVLVGSLMLLEERGLKPALRQPPPPPPSPFADNPAYRDMWSLQRAFVRNAKNIRPAVVSIKNLKKITPVFHGHDPRQPQSWFSKLKWWLQNRLNRRYQVEHAGSGLILDQKGHILTNWHLLKDADRLRVKLFEGGEFAADIVGFDSLTDLAVLKIFTLNRLPTAPLGQSKDIDVGEWVMAIGNPYGLDGTVSVGVISSKNLVSPDNPGFDGLIRTDAAINPGGSGGPLIDVRGKIVGINSVHADLDAQWEFTIPIETAIRISNQLIRHGKVERGWLGIGIQSLTPELAASFNLSGVRGGVLVNTVETETPAEHGGLKRGDIIIRFDGKPVSRTHMLQKWVAASRIGKDVPVGILRNGNEKILHVIVGRLDS